MQQVQQVQQVQRVASHQTIRLTREDVARLPKPEAAALRTHWRLLGCSSVKLPELRQIMSDRWPSGMDSITLQMPLGKTSYRVSMNLA